MSHPQHSPERWRSALPCVIASLLCLLSGCLLEGHGGPAFLLNRDDPGVGVALDLRQSTAELRDDVGSDLGLRARVRVSGGYSEVGLGADAGLIRRMGLFGLRLRGGAAVAPLVLRGEDFGFSPFGAFGEMGVIFCTDICLETDGEGASTQQIVSLQLGVDWRAHFRTSELILGQDAFFYFSVGVGSFINPL